MLKKYLFFVLIICQRTQQQNALVGCNSQATIDNVRAELKRLYAEEARQCGGTQLCLACAIDRLSQRENKLTQFCIDSQQDNPIFRNWLANDTSNPDSCQSLRLAALTDCVTNAATNTTEEDLRTCYDAATTDFNTCVAEIDNFAFGSAPDSQANVPENKADCVGSDFLTTCSDSCQLLRRYRFFDCVYDDTCVHTSNDLMNTCFANCQVTYSTVCEAPDVIGTDEGQVDVCLDENTNDYNTKTFMQRCFGLNLCLVQCLSRTSKELSACRVECECDYECGDEQKQQECLDEYYTALLQCTGRTDL